MSSILRVVKSATVTEAMLTSTSVPEADHAAWSSVTTYANAARVIKVHKIWESLQASNTNHDPETSALWWAEVSPTNRWKLFDLSGTTQTVVDADDYYEITPAQVVNALALINTGGLQTVRVRLTDPVFGAQYDQTLNVATYPDEATWHAWFFGLRVEQTQIVLSDLPSYPSAVLRVDVTTSGVGYIGAMVLGSMRTLGLGVKYGAKLGIQDYSRKERNVWGDTLLVKRANSKRLSLSMEISNTQLNDTYQLLSEIAGTPALWIPTDFDTFTALVLFGFYQDFEIDIQYANHSECSLTIEGFT
jgi:hypothetical protein